MVTHEVAEVFRSGHSLRERKGNHGDIVLRLRKLQLSSLDKVFLVKDSLVLVRAGVIIVVVTSYPNHLVADVQSPVFGGP